MKTIPKWPQVYQVSGRWIIVSTRVSEPLGFLEQKASKCQVNWYVCRTPPKLKSNLHRVLTVPSKHSAMEKLAFEAQGLVVLIVLGLFILVNFGQCRFRQAFSPVFMLKLVPGIGKIFLLWRSLHLAHWCWARRRRRRCRGTKPRSWRCSTLLSDRRSTTLLKARPCWGRSQCSLRSRCKALTMRARAWCHTLGNRARVPSLSAAL